MPEVTTEATGYTELTQGTLDGTGSFDVLARAVKAQLEVEFKEGRIRGTDYANVFSASIVQILAQASQYAISKAKLPSELALIDAQTAVAEQQLVNLRVEAANNTKQLELTEKNICKAEAEVTKLNLENEFKLPEEIKALRKQAMILAAQVDINLKELEIKEKELTLKLPEEIGLLVAQKELYSQKTTTEKAQVDNSVVGASSVIDNNNKLLVEQSKVYLRNAQQAAAKIMIDTWNVRHTADPDGNLENTSNKLQDANIGVVVDSMINNLSN